jgi:hypothetical protein
MLIRIAVNSSWQRDSYLFASRTSINRNADTHCFDPESGQNMAVLGHFDGQNGLKS